MAAWIFFALFFIPQLQVQGKDDCFIPWSVTLNENRFLKWEGEDRDLIVRIRIKSDINDETIHQTGCKNQSNTEIFNFRNFQIVNLCANTTHKLEVGLICEDDSLAQIKTFTIQTHNVEVPSNLAVAVLTNTSVKLQWNKSNADKEITAYHVWKSPNEPQFFNDHIFLTKDLSIFFKGLTPFTNYSFKVRARTDIAYGPWSEILTIRTLVGVPLAPQFPSPEDRTNSSLTIRWGEPDPSRGPIHFYEIKWTSSFGKTSTGFQDGNSSNKTRDYGIIYFFHKMESLEANTMYIIQVRAYTEAGPGPWSYPLQIATSVGIPSVPINLMALNVSDTSIRILWDAPVTANGILLEYLVTWGIRGVEPVQVSINGTEFLANNLKPSTTYVFQVAASTRAGFGHPTKPLHVTTEMRNTVVPTNLAVAVLTNTSLKLQWNKPSTDEEIAAYHVWISPNVELRYDLNIFYGNVYLTRDLSIFFKGLKPFTVYSFKVRATSDIAHGPWSEKLTIQTPAGVPLAPTYLTPDGRTNSSISIKWRETDPFTGPILSYEIKWRTDFGIASTGFQDGNSTNKRQVYETVWVLHKIENLDADTVYVFQVRAYTEAGPGPWSHSLRIVTLVANPEIET